MSHRETEHLRVLIANERKVSTMAAEQLLSRE
jgi:hypothetical protein